MCESFVVHFPNSYKWNTAAADNTVNEQQSDREMYHLLQGF